MLKPFLFVFKKLRERKNPTRWAWDLFSKRERVRNTQVTIPHGGLGTKNLNGGAAMVKISPSHPVGSKNRTPPASIYADLEIVRSPSHAVGSERGQGDSIPVGRQAGGGADVTIPHGGLGMQACHRYHFAVAS
jgi:hypothetical protein